MRKKQEIKINDKIVELVTVGREYLQKNQKKYFKSFTKIAISAGQNPENHVCDWINTADYAVIIREKDGLREVGFIVYCFLGRSTIHIPVAMVIPSYQNGGIISKIIKKIIKEFILFRVIRFFIDPIGTISPIYIFFRTQNPSLYLSLYNNKRIKLYPNPNFDIIPNKIIEIASKYSQKLWPYASLDKRKFILNNAYNKHPFLALNYQNINWSGNSLVDNFFKERLSLNTSGKSKNALVVVGEIKTLFLFKFFKT